MKTYTINGETYDHIPDPLTVGGLTYSPVTEKLFRELGGTIHDDGEPTARERVCASFVSLIADLAQKTDKITPEEFLSLPPAAATENAAAVPDAAPPTEEAPVPSAAPDEPDSSAPVSASAEEPSAPPGAPEKEAGTQLDFGF